MRSKGFNITGEKQAELQQAKSQALGAMGDQLGYTPEQRDRAVQAVNDFMFSWYTSGGQSATRREFEAAWQRLRQGQPQDTDVDRAVMLQKAYSDMTWDERQNGDAVDLIRGVSGSYGTKIAVADALGEDWTARTWPLTSWAVPGGEASVKNWVGEQGGVMLTSSGGTSRDEVLAMYHSEPLLREKGLKVKGEYIVDGSGAVDSGDVSVGRIDPKAASTSWSSAPKIDSVISSAREFHDQTGGDSSDFFLGKILDESLSGEGPFSFPLNHTDKPGVRDWWRVLGFEEPPSVLGRETTTSSEHNAAKKELADEFRARGVTDSDASALLSEWYNYQSAWGDADRIRKGLAMPNDPDPTHSYGYAEPSPPRSDEQRTYWERELLPLWDAKWQAALNHVTGLRQQLGIDDVPLPDITTGAA